MYLNSLFLIKIPTVGIIVIPQISQGDAAEGPIS